MVGSLALAGIPPFSGFFSKDAIIEAVHLSKIPGHGYAYFAVMAGVFITAFYSFRMLFLAFHGEAAVRGMPQAREPRRPARARLTATATARHHGGPPKESPWVVTVPLILLAIPSVYAGWTYMEPMLFGDYFGGSIVVRPEHAVLWELKDEWHGVAAFVQHGVLSLPFWLAIGGIVAAWYCYLVNPSLPERLRKLAGPVYTLLENKYGFDRFNEVFFAGGARKLGIVPVQRRRPHDHRRLLRQRHGEGRRHGGLAAALRPVRLRLPLRVHHDHRPLRAADLVDVPLAARK